MLFSFLLLGNDKLKKPFFRFSSVAAEEPLAFLAFCCDILGLLEEYMQTFSDVPSILTKLNQTNRDIKKNWGRGCITDLGGPFHPYDSNLSEYLSLSVPQELHLPRFA